jgi:histidinol-phosphate/aromatic aminotransferase/cobyric acid decarboxylase-like protein/choline kinase
MQALMLAAGMGKRLGKYTDNNTKCMLEVAGKKLVDRTIDAVKFAGIKKFVIVVGYEGDNLINYLNKKYKNDKDIEFEFINNTIYNKTNNIYSLFLAKDSFMKDDTILLESDLIFDKEIIKKIVENKNPNVATVAKYASWMDGTVVNVGEDNIITQFIEKKDFDYSKIDGYYKTVNIYKFSKEFINNQYMPFLSAYIKAYGENEYYETVLKAISHLSRSHIRAHILEKEKWYEIDDAQDYDISTALFSEGETKLRHMQNKYGGYWRYDGLLDYCYLVNPYFPNKKMVDKMKNEYDILLRQYPSGLNIQNLNAGRMFGVDADKLLVGNGAAELINVLQKVIKGKLGVCVPTFNEYIRCFPDCEIVKLNTSLTDYAYDVDEILKHIDKVDNMVIINPDNPSGSLIHYDDIIRIIEKCHKQNKLIVFDESFIDFAQKELRYTLIDDNILNKYQNLIVIKSISKSYGVPGLRLGIMACGNKEIINTIRQNMAVWNINSFAEYFLQIITLYQKDYFKACDRIAEEREYMTAELRKAGYKVYGSQANFIMVKLHKNSTQTAINLLEKQNILIKDLYKKDTFNKPEYIRLAIRNREDNERIIATLIREASL